MMKKSNNSRSLTRETDRTGGAEGLAPYSKARLQRRLQKLATNGRVRDIDTKLSHRQAVELAMRRTG